MNIRSMFQMRITCTEHCGAVKVEPGGRLEEGRIIVGAEGEGGEKAHAGGVDGRGEVLEDHDPCGLCADVHGIELLRQAEDLGGDGVASHVASAAVRGGIVQADSWMARPS